MSKFAKGKTWIEHRLANDLELNGGRYTVDLVARKGTGVPGFRVTVVYIPHDAGPHVEIDLPNAPSTADVHRVSRELAADPLGLERRFREAAAR
ncbi:MAG: hypothetical protein L0271_19885 [Gemmatimonadetes bacterium]|nr:hypothetical protein [Gemmatimonadota bacterium]